MKLSTSLDSLERENRYLKLTIKALLLLSILCTGLSLAVSDRPPLIVERSSRGLEVVRTTEFMRTPEDLKEAIGLMLRARFETSAIAPELFLNQKQLLLRDTEQKDMKARGMSQSIVVRSVSISKDSALAELDRVISVGEVRSALKAKVKVSFEETSPNELNPFGLLLSLADPVEQKEERK